MKTTVRNAPLATMLLFAICCVTTVAEAATVSLTKNSNNGFVAADGWNSGEEPKSGNNYIVADGYILRGDNSQGFAGDSLQFGIVGGSEGTFFKEHTGTHTFTKLILANGCYRTWMSRTGQEAHIVGTVEVTSPESAPFRLHSSHNGGSDWYVTSWDATFTGTQGSGLKIGPHPNALTSPCQTIFTGDNSGYLGSIEAYGTNAVFAFKTGNSLGGALSAFKADALSLCDGTTLESRGADVTLAASLNRGIFVNETGGRISVPAGNALRVEWPISGSGTLKKIGEGTLTLASAMSQTVPFVIDGTGIMLASGFSNSGNSMISVPRGGEICVKPGDEVEVRNLVLEGGAIRLSYDANAAQSGVLVLGDGCEPNWPIPVYTLSTRGLKIPFLKVPTSMKTVTAADFVKPDDFAATGLPSATFTVETEGTYQIVYAEMAELVTVTETVDGSTNPKAYIAYGSEAKRWSDSRLPHAGSDYQVQNGKTLYTQGVSANEYTFPGESLSIRGASGAPASLNINDGNITNYVIDMRTYDYVKVYPNASFISELHISGRLYVGGAMAADNCLDFRASVNDMAVVIDSVVSGSGYMSFQPANDYYTNTYCFTANNTFDGTFFVYGGRTDSKTVLKFANEDSWGKDAVALRDGVTLQLNAEIYPVGSQTINLPNRRIKFYAGGQKVRVDDGEVFEVKSPLLFSNGSSSQYVVRADKIGGGTWAVGGTVSVDRNGLSEYPSLAISEGYLRADNPRAFVDIAVMIEEGAGIEAKYRPGDASEVATYGMIVTNAAHFAISGNTLKLKVVTGGEEARASERIAILTVPEATAAVIDAKAVKFEHDDTHGRSPVLEKDIVEVSGSQYVRYSCRFLKGMMIILQ